MSTDHSNVTSAPNVNDDLLPGLLYVMDHLSRDALKVYVAMRCELERDRTTYETMDGILALFPVNETKRADDALVELLGKGLIVNVVHDERSLTPATIFRVPELRWLTARQG